MDTLFGNSISRFDFHAGPGPAKHVAEKIKKGCTDSTKIGKWVRRPALALSLSLSLCLTLATRRGVPLLAPQSDAWYVWRYWQLGGEEAKENIRNMTGSESVCAYCRRALLLACLMTLGATVPQAMQTVARKRPRCLQPPKRRPTTRTTLSKRVPPAMMTVMTTTTARTRTMPTTTTPRREEAGLGRGSRRLQAWQVARHEAQADGVEGRKGAPAKEAADRRQQRRKEVRLLVSSCADHTCRGSACSLPAFSSAQFGWWCRVFIVRCLVTGTIAWMLWVCVPVHVM